jgi:hypothetical protein
MSIKPFISDVDQFPVEPLVAEARFVACLQQDRFTFRIERESNKA